MIYSGTIFGIHFNINPIAFTLPIGDGWKIYWYGVIIAAGFLGALLYAFKTAPKLGINTDRMTDVILVTTPVAILCARSYYLIFFDKGITSFKQFFGLGTSSGFSGLAIYGGVIGAFVCGAVMCKVRKVNILDMFDITAIGFLLAQGIGRWGNFMNQEAYGTFTGSTFFGMQSNRTISEMGEGLVHPCFLYESIWCIAGFFLLNYLLKKRKYSGQIILFYGVWYGFERAILETIRTDSLMLGNIRVSGLLSIILCVACTAILAIKYIKAKREVTAEEYTPVFADKKENKDETD